MVTTQQDETHTTRFTQHLMFNQPSVLPEDNSRGISVLPDGTGTPSNPVDETVAKQRAAKAQWAMGDDTRTYDATYNAITSGYESVIRNQDAVNAQLEERKRRLGVIQEMTKDGVPLDPVSRDMIISLSQDKLQNPNTVWEEEYAKKVVDTALNIKPFPQFDQSMESNPDETLDAMDAAQNAIARKEIAQHKLESLNQRWEEQSLGSKAVDFGLSIVPFVSWYNLQNRLKDAKAVSVLPGNNQLEQIEYLHSLPPGEFELALDQALQEISQLSTLDAITFAQAAVGLPASEVGLTNLFGVLDVADIAAAPVIGLARVGRKAAKTTVERMKNPTTAVKGALKSTVEAVGKQDATVGKVVAATGDVDSGALLEAVGRYTQRVLDRRSYRDKLVSGNVPNIKEMRNTLTSIFNPGDFFDPAKAKTNAVLKSLENNAEVLARTITDMNTVDRLTPDALRKAAQEAIESMKLRYGASVNNAILDVGEEIFSHNPQTNTYTASINIGKPDKTLFETPTKAFKYAEDVYKLPDNSYSLEQQGTGYYIKVSKDLDETTSDVRDLLVPTEGTRDTMANMFLGLLRTPEELLDVDQRAARHTATYGPGEFQRAVRPMLDTIQSLGKKGRERLARVLEANRDHVEMVDGKPNRGMYYQSEADFYAGYKDITGQSPTDADVEAYMNYRMLSDFDYMIRNFGIYRDYVRQGAEEARFHYFVPGTERTEATSTPNFVVKRVDELPLITPRTLVSLCTTARAVRQHSVERTVLVLT